MNLVGNGKQRIDLCEWWIEGMNQYLACVDEITGFWRAASVDILGARWVKRILLNDQKRVVVLVLDYHGTPLACIPVNFSYSSPELKLVVDNS